jgi:hypothetical protein
MGLDMYLSARQYINRMDFSTEAKSETPGFTNIVDTLGVRDLIEPDGFSGAYVELPVMYWRKSNAIHNWFVREFADGVDDCRPMSLTTEQLRELVELCDIVREDNGKAEELLPTGSGFFFGATDYDEWYFEDIAHTADRLRYIVNEMDSRQMDYLVYQASW